MPLYIAKAKPVGLKYVGSDTTLGYARNTTTETVIGQVTIPANTIKTGIVVTASITAENNTSNILNAYVFRIRCGTAGDTSDTEYATQISSFLGIATERHRDMGVIITYVTGLDWTVDNYVSVTVQMGFADDRIRGYCEDLVVLGK